jgi:hypothetical protein
MVIAAPRIDNYEQTARRADTKRHESPLIDVGFIIRDRDGVRIVKNRNRLGHSFSRKPFVFSSAVCE